MCQRSAPPSRLPIWRDSLRVSRLAGPPSRSSPKSSEGWLANRSSRSVGKRERRLVRPEGVEPPAYRFEACRSIQLSYGRPGPLYRERSSCPASLLRSALFRTEPRRTGSRTVMPRARHRRCSNRAPRVEHVPIGGSRRAPCAGTCGGAPCGCARITFCPGAIIGAINIFPPRAGSSIGRAADS
jgi:hypothetical protein